MFAWARRHPGQAAGAILALLAALAILILVLRSLELAPGEVISSSGTPSTPPAGAAALEEQEQRAAQTYWGPELLAQRHGQTIEALWDSLNAASNKFSLLAALPFEELRIPTYDTRHSLAHGVLSFPPESPEIVLTPVAWRELLARLDRTGWHADQFEFRQVAFDPPTPTHQARSRFDFSAHLTCKGEAARACLRGELGIVWQPDIATNRPPGISHLDASQLTLWRHDGPPWFVPVLRESIVPDDGAYFIDPLIAHDLDGDGFAEFVLAVKNRVYRRNAAGLYDAEPLCPVSPGAIFTALVADFDGDGWADFLCARADGLLLYRGHGKARFDGPPELVWKAPEPLKNPMAFTCADIDQDGDLDVFLGQYRVPLLAQSLRPHYYDANDGHPAYLLRNDGHGRFEDVTGDSGLAASRRRRMFSASFVDWNGDHHPDLVVVSDFHGLTLFENNGHGQFEDVTAARVAESHAFGMAQTMADFDGDGRPDLLMIGMNSPTADRLEHLGLQRPSPGEDPSMRSRMAHGNRLYLVRPDSRWVQSPLSDTIARTGWSWGCGALDFDNDGWTDIYIANGHQSKQSVREYEPEFWLHDIFVEENVSDVAASTYFVGRYTRTRGQGWSYGGYDKNRFGWNQAGQGFTEVGHLAGLALEADSRNVIAEDIDGDGRVDLLVTTFEVWPETRQTLQVYRNTLPDPGHWIGIRFAEGPGQPSPVGATVTLQVEDRKLTQPVVAGDGFRSQRSSTIHFGLAGRTRVDRIKVRWLDGRSLDLETPAVDRYHTVRVAPQPPEH